MTVNSLSTTASTPFTGLATQTYNVPATGLYQISVVCTLPWLSSDQPQAAANPAARNVQTITAVADDSGSLNDTYFEFYLAGNAPFQIAGTWYSFVYVWYNINSAGTDPAPTGGYGIEVDAATGASASTLGGDTRAAISAALTAATLGNNNYPIVTGTTTHCILTNAEYGACTAAVDTGATGFTFATGTAGSFGETSGLVLTLKHGSTTVAVSSQPSPSQAQMGAGAEVQCTAGDTLTITTSSLAGADAMSGAIKGIANIFPLN